MAVRRACVGSVPGHIHTAAGLVQQCASEKKMGSSHTLYPTWGASVRYSRGRLPVLWSTAVLVPALPEQDHKQQEGHQAEQAAHGMQAAPAGE